jgi:hypothetical protein
MQNLNSQCSRLPLEESLPRRPALPQLLKAIRVRPGQLKCARGVLRFLSGSNGVRKGFLEAGRIRPTIPLLSATALLRRITRHSEKGRI